MKALVAVLLVLGSSAFGSVFEDMEKSFWDGDLPEHKDVTGYWAGRCAVSTTPNDLEPAVLIHKLVKDESGFPPTRPSFTYFYDKGKAPDLFDKMSVQQIESHPGVKKWLEREQWQRIDVVDGALVNYFDGSEKLRTKRALRSYDSEFEKLLILQVTRITKTEAGETSAVQSYCYFNTKISGSVIDPDPTTTDFPPVGPVSNQWISVINSQPQNLYRRLAITNLGNGIVTIRNLEWYTPTGMKYVDSRPLTLAPGQAMQWFSIGAPVFQLSRVNFYVGGSTSRLQVQGIP